MGSLTFRQSLFLLLVATVAVVSVFAYGQAQTRRCCLNNVGGPSNACTCTQRLER